ncbi:hypothetical protein [Nocardia jejuensis]|uniref:hypothetical protein n=1 Tax=Nocardia jejuensis TaxID=328049 RepID=UPI00082D5F5F|nr:hypothetical protein [Nocardia jejuensis]
MRTVCLNCLSELKFDRASKNWIWVIRQPNGHAATKVAGYTAKLSQRCPNGCDIDEETLNHPTKVIGFVGESASSKTHLIASMIYSMMNDPVMSQDWSIIPSRKSVKQWSALENLLINRRAIGATEKRQFTGGQLQRMDAVAANAMQRPMPPRPSTPVHPWSGLEQRAPILVKASSVHTRRTVNLAFVDVAGEDVADGKTAAQVSPHLAVADFLWFVVPSTLNKQYLAIMREHANDANEESLGNDVEHSQTVGRTVPMIDQIATLWREANSYPVDLPIEPPRLHVSSIVAKSDLLSLLNFPEVSVVAPPANWADSPYSTNGSGNLYSRDQIDYRSDATRSLVRKLFPQIDNTLALHFPWNRYFPVSAVGCGKRADNSYPVFKPYGAVDPMLYMLSLFEELWIDR